MKNISLRACALALPCTLAEAAKRPNVLWFVVDDMSANFSCYGEKNIRTPAVDQLAEEGPSLAGLTPPRRLA